MMVENLDMNTLAFVVFLVSLLLTIIISRQSAKQKGRHGKRIRSIYRREWVTEMVKSKSYPNIINTLRNNLIFSTSIFSAMIIALGFLLNGYSGEVDAFTDIKILSVVALLTYTLLMIISEIRILVYIPVVSAINPATIKKYESQDKIDYLTELLDGAFNSFSNSMKTLFYLIATLLWFYNPFLFIIAVVLLTIIIVRDDLSEHSHIHIF